MGMPMRLLVGSEEWTYVNDPDGHSIRWQDRRALGSQLGSMRWSSSVFQQH